MNLYALGAGTATAACVVAMFRRTRPETRQWAYPLLLSTFPVYYCVFAVYGSDDTALQRELYAGALVIALSYWAYCLRGFNALVVLAIGYVGHAVYDFGHNALFMNSGAPLWWPEFCGSVDMLIGVYLLVMATLVKMRQGRIA